MFVNKGPLCCGANSSLTCVHVADEGLCLHRSSIDVTSYDVLLRGCDMCEEIAVRTVILIIKVDMCLFVCLCLSLLQWAWAVQNYAVPEDA